MIPVLTFNIEARCSVALRLKVRSSAPGELLRVSKSIEPGFELGPITAGDTFDDGGLNGRVSPAAKTSPGPC